MNQSHRPGAAPQRPAEMDFETIKTRAGRIFAAALEAEAAYRGVHRDSDSPTYRALRPFHPLGRRRARQPARIRAVAACAG